MKKIIVDYVERGRYVEAVAVHVGYTRRPVCFRAATPEKLFPVCAGDVADHPKFSVEMRRV